MQLPKRALLFGFLSWVVWMPTIMGLLMLMSKEYAASIVGMSMPAILLVISVLIFALLYLRKIGRGAWQEGLYLGLVWMIIFTVFDIGHYVVMGSFDLGSYLTRQFPVYIGIPILTTLLLHFAQAKSK